MNKAKYKFFVKTGDLDKAGTDANVYIILCGVNGQTKKAFLNPLIQGNAFERGNLDIIDNVKLDNVGEIKSIIIGHDNQHLYPGWFLEYINVLDITDNRYYHFPCHQWLSKNNEDGKIERTLFVNTDPNEDAYFITIKTGSMDNAGTNANVYIVLHGDEKETEKIVLNPLMQGKVFTRGATDQVLIKPLSEIGFIHSITIAHDNRNCESGWFLEKVTVLHTHTGQEWEFNCYEWLSIYKGDKKIERTLSVNPTREKASWSKRPFYAIAHMCNNREMLKKAIKCGANAIECDIKVENPDASADEPYKFIVHHGFYPILEYGINSTPIDMYLKELKKVMPDLAMVMFDCKDCAGADYKRYGKELCALLMKHSIDPKYCVMSVPYLDMAGLFDGMKEAGFNAAKDISMFEKSTEGIAAFYWLTTVEPYGCDFLGMGIDAYNPFSPVRNWIAPLDYTCDNKFNKNIVKKVYYYTLNNLNSTKKVIDTGADGIICNMKPSDEVVWEGLEGLIKLFKDSRYCHTHCLATQEDSMDEAFGYIDNPFICSKLKPNKKYFIRNGSKHLIPDEKTISSMRFKRDAVVLEDSEFIKIPMGEVIDPLPFPLIKVSGSDRLYLMDQGRRRLVPNENVLNGLGYKRSQAVIIPKEQMDRIWLDKNY